MTPDPAQDELTRRDVGRVVVSRDRIARKVRDLADEISQAYDGRELTVVAVLTGSLIFLADLVRHLPVRMRLDVASVCSYPGKAVRAQEAEFRLAPTIDLEGKDVQIVDDILDSGRTLGLLKQRLEAMGAADVRSCVLLRKRRPDVPGRPEADFVGFDIDDEFVVGYGLDYDHLYRNLPDLCVLGRRWSQYAVGGRPQ